jgi:hypothetical protein
MRTYVFLSGLLLLYILQPAASQFREDFNQPTSGFREQSIPGWNAVRGDGEGIFTQQIQNGVATLRIDAGRDPRNITASSAASGRWLTLGSAIIPLGIINAVLIDSAQEGGKYAARLRMNMKN